MAAGSPNSMNNAHANISTSQPGPVKKMAAITDASTAHALSATFSDVEVETALNALGTKINSLLAALRTSGALSS